MTAKNYRVLVGFDFSELGVMALEGGVHQVAAVPGAELHLVGVVNRGGLGPFDKKTDLTTLDRVRLELERYAKKAISAANAGEMPVYAHARAGNAAAEIAGLADEQDIDLIVVGTHGRHGFKRLFQGSVAEHVVRDAPCPVLVVRPKNTSAERFAPEPPCPQCVAVRNASNGEQMWCDFHTNLNFESHVGGRKRHEGSGAWTLYNH